MNSLLNLTGDEAAFFATLPSKEREAIVARLAAVAAVTNAKHGTKGDIERRFAAELGVHRSTVATWGYRFKEKGWRGLIDERAMPRLVGSRTRK